MKTHLQGMMFGLVVASLVGFGWWLASRPGPEDVASVDVSDPDIPIVEPVLLPVLAEDSKAPSQDDNQGELTAEEKEALAWFDAMPDRVAESRRRADALHDELVEPTQPWKERYGDHYQSKICYNVVMLRAVLNQHAQVINNLRAPSTQPTSQPVEKP